MKNTLNALSLILNAKTNRPFRKLTDKELMDGYDNICKDWKSAKKLDAKAIIFTVKRIYLTEFNLRGLEA